MESKRARKAESKQDVSTNLQAENYDDEASDSSMEQFKEDLQKLEPQVPKTFQEKNYSPRLIVVLEQANLETAKTKRGIELINCDDHQKLITKMKKSYEDFRPDVTHQVGAKAQSNPMQCLLALLDSPLNKAGLLQVYIRTVKNVLIEINPQIRIPRTFKRFSGLMAQLLTKLKIRSSTSSVTLMKVVKNPITDHFPLGARIIGTSSKAKLVHPGEYVKSIGTDQKPVVFVVGAVSIGNPGMEAEYVNESISISSYGLSAACVCSKMCFAFEDTWKVL